MNFQKTEFIGFCLHLSGNLNCYNVRYWLLSHCFKDLRIYRHQIQPLEINLALIICINFQKQHSTKYYTSCMCISGWCNLYCSTI
jgi:hypothetical protein